MYAGLDGLQRRLDPGPSADVPYESKVDILPTSLAEALVHLKQDAWLNQCLGSAFIDYFIHIKQAEIARFNLEVTEWEHREYFEMF